MIHFNIDLRKAVKYFWQVLMMLVLLVASGAASAGLVKKTSSGVCHPPASSYYERTKNFTPFDSVESCIASGGRLPKALSQTQVAQAQMDGARSYKRSEFGHGWADADGDCRDSRAEALIAASSTAVRFATDKGCRVVTGRWISPYTGNVIQNSSEIDIDHVVPLAWAWDRGADLWAREKRERFANDPVNLLPVEARLNRSKGAKGPDEWLPPSAQCGYVARFYRVVKQYGLKPSSSETAWIQSFLNACRS